MDNSNQKNSQENSFQPNFNSISNDNVVLAYDCIPDKIDAFKSKVCTYFIKYGNCKFGNDCNYIHEKTSKIQETKYHKNLKVYRNSKELKDKKESTASKKINFVSDSLRDFNNGYKQICRYFKAGYCEKGDYCSFQHSYSVNKEKYFNSSPVNYCYNKHSAAKNINESKKRSIPICYYFKKGMCHKGNHCKFYHQKKAFVNSLEKNDSSIPENQKEDQVNCESKNLEEILDIENSMSATTKTPNIDLVSSNDENLVKLRETEINQMRKRFPRHEVIVEQEAFYVTIQPSDPDWPFDLKNLKVEVKFPEKYPTEKCILTVVHGEEYIPELLIKFLNKSIIEWIDARYESNAKNNKNELVFRPFLKWFDKNLEELFIAGLRKVKQDLKAKEAGIEFVPVENLFPTTKENDVNENIFSNENSNSDDDVQTQNSDNTYPPTLHESDAQLLQGSNNNGFKIIFSELELTEGAAALICTKVSLTLNCSRCKTSFSMKSTPKKNNSHICSKCSKELGFVFDPSTIHQFSSVLGNIYLLDCLAVDVNLVECQFLVDCLNCSKQVAIDGIHYGQKHKMWCTFCHDKVIISIGSVKFQTLKLESIPTVKYVPAKKLVKKVKDPVIKENEPLPNFGTCKHYKKSYRWLRFPCCGRLYPCDECHNEKEIDHEMKYATRMVCGFCSKEQPYSREKPCILCSQGLTKKPSSHWEGGKGCRNKMKMCRDDKHKYSGISKTVSKKAQSVKK